MIVLLSGGPPKARKELPAWAGGIITPTADNSPRRYVAQSRPWALDNAAYSGWDAAAYWRCLVRFRTLPGCLWAAVPDVVGDHAATLRRWHGWAWLVKSLGYPLAFVGQDGATPAWVPWTHMGALFIGGSTAWKLGPDAVQIIRAAQARGLWVHMGRVNTGTRTRYAHSVGVDSIDGTGWSRFWADTSRKCAPHLHARQSRFGDAA